MKEKNPKKEDEKCVRKFLSETQKEKEYKTVQQFDGYCFLFISSGSVAARRDADSMVVNGILGESVTFPLNMQEPQKIDNIAWTSQSSVAFVKPEVNRTEVTITQVIYKGRIEVTGQNYDLQPCTDTPSFHPHHAVLPWGLAVLFLLILILVLALLYHLCKRRRDRMVLEADDVSKKTVYTVVSRNAHPTESRNHDEIPQSKMLSNKEEPVTTIYPSVQLSEKMGKANMMDERPPKTLGNETLV
ncbi:SLAM family member 5-like [Mastomys coucha]|uniref:SLAM family member 5-like n=1 Tax=Mastomys coucha TaxID=35658 RepID=UPI001261BFF4|nr:SLAM family member 5-like [Mastomys coucha]